MSLSKKFDKESELDIEFEMEDAVIAVNNFRHVDYGSGQDDLLLSSGLSGNDFLVAMTLFAQNQGLDMLSVSGNGQTVVMTGPISLSNPVLYELNRRFSFHAVPESRINELMKKMDKDEIAVRMNLKLERDDNGNVTQEDWQMAPARLDA